MNVFQNAPHCTAKIVLDVLAKDVMTIVDNAKFAFHVYPVLRIQKDRVVTNASHVKRVSRVHHAHPIFKRVIMLTFRNIKIIINSNFKINK